MKIKAWLGFGYAWRGQLRRQMDDCDTDYELIEVFDELMVMCYMMMMATISLYKTFQFK